MILKNTEQSIIIICLKKHATGYNVFKPTQGQFKLFTVKLHHSYKWVKINWNCWNWINSNPTTKDWTQTTSPQIHNINISPQFSSVLIFHFHSILFSFHSYLIADMDSKHTCYPTRPRQHTSTNLCSAALPAIFNPASFSRAMTA